MLRFDRLRAHNVGPFADIDVDFSALPAIVAVTGPNGAGKSTLLELLGGALFRDCPTRGPLVGLARARDSWVEVACVNGAPWNIRQSVDAVNGKGEALVRDGAGTPALTSTKVREMDAWAALNLPAPSVLYSSTFGVQGSAGFLELKPADRKGVLLRVLGVERLEALAEKAREQLRGARGRHATASALAEAVVGVSADQAERAWLDLVDVEVLAIERARDAVARLREARELAAARAEIMRELGARAGQRDGLARRIDALDVTIREAEQRIANNRGLVEKRAEIEDAVATLAGYRARIATLDAQLVASTAEERRLDDVVSSTWAARAEELDRWVDTCLARERRAKPIAALRPVVDEAAAALPLHEAAAIEAEREHEAAIAAAEALAGQAIAGAEQRIADLRSGLDAICHVDGEEPDAIDIAQTIAIAALAADDGSIEQAGVLPGQKATARAKLVAAADACSRAMRTVREAEALVARAEEVRLAQLEIVGVAAERGQIADARVALAEAVNGAHVERQRVRDATAASRAERAEVSRAFGALEPLAVRAEHLAKATARIEELDAAIAKARADRETLEVQLVELGTDDAVIPPVVDVAGFERAESAAQQALAHASSARAVALREHELAKERAEKRAKLEADRDAIAVEISDWSRLAADLGKDGIQALEIDAAGPEISALANDLLHTCVGPRWTVTIDTQRSGADGRLLESLEVRVLDTEAGRDAPVETYSGGERVLLGEAVSLALAMLACRRSGQRDVTIVRDESGAALDGERGRAYVAMLRRALTLTGARQVLLVSHDPEVAALCDCRLHVENGCVEVCS